MLNEAEREELGRRWDLVHEELRRLEDLKVHRTGEALVDFGKREADLLTELDEIEGTLGEDYIERKRRERSRP
jgi:hypothetical protein